MDRNSNPQETLLSLSANAQSLKKGSTVSLAILKWVMKIIMCLFFVMWVAIIFLFPLDSAKIWIRAWSDATSPSFLGLTVVGNPKLGALLDIWRAVLYLGSVFVLFGGPLVVISLLSALYLVLYSDEQYLQDESIKGKKARYRLWTLPVVVRGPFGVVSASELIGIGVVCAYVVWVAGVFCVQKFTVPFQDADYTTFEKWTWVVKLSGRGCGLAGMFCLSLMFIPVARGSPLLQMLNISQEHGIRYHIWLGHLSMSLFTFHGLLYFISWIMADELSSQALSWHSEEGANIPGIIGIFFGWAIWITSLPFVRLHNFELFYYTHHLYILFLIFLAMHVGDFLFCIVAGSVFLFMIDRFLRFCQSRKTVDVISATAFPCGVVQLIMPIPPSVKHNALSSIFLQLRELSWLQWHPFSVSNSPLDGKNYLSVLVKDSGNWTSQLQHHSTNLTASVEGPYGYQYSYYLTYEHLILVAGGVGIAPFIAVLSDIFDRVKKGKPCLATNILLVWAMKTTDELSLLSTFDMEFVPSADLNLQILIYITRQSQPLFENGVSNKAPAVVPSSVVFGSTGNSISSLTSAGNKRWFAAYLLSSTIGVIALISINYILFVSPFEIVNWWIQGLLLLACMAAGVSLVGGAIIRLWHVSEKDDVADEEFDLPSVTNDSFIEYFGGSMNFHYASRPDFKEIFEWISKEWGNVDAGVIVCGPQSLQESVAMECRSLNFKRQFHQTVFHFHSHSFST